MWIAEREVVRRFSSDIGTVAVHSIPKMRYSNIGMENQDSHSSIGIYSNIDINPRDFHSNIGIVLRYLLQPHV
jgi:hypothetical protein